ncbi:hypothetical protein BGZ57DRAFT_881196 [Hyaloscypha finlandica]|nr:hypothetical protein BGZ57DRAFT_881196 [Hyaloscypha finlandica]
MCKSLHLASLFCMASIRLIPYPSFSGHVSLHISYRASTNMASIRISIAAFGDPCARHQRTFLVQGNLILQGIEGEKEAAPALRNSALEHCRALTD